MKAFTFLVCFTRKFKVLFRFYLRGNHNSFMIGYQFLQTLGIWFFLLLSFFLSILARTAHIRFIIFIYIFLKFCLSLPRISFLFFITTNKKRSFEIVVFYSTIYRASRLKQYILLCVPVLVCVFSVVTQTHSLSKTSKRRATWLTHEDSFIHGLEA